MTDRGRLVLRAGWVPATAALVLASVTTLTIIVTATDFEWLTSRLAVGGLIVFVIGTAAGSERVVGAATAPLLGSALLGATAADQVAWGRSMVIGCVWYVAVELAWASIERRDGSQRSAAVTVRRLQEVATVVVVALIVSLVGLAGSMLAPERTLVIQMAAIAAVLAALVVAVRHLVRTGPQRAMR